MDYHCKLASELQRINTGHGRDYQKQLPALVGRSAFRSNRIAPNKTKKRVCSLLWAIGIQSS